MRCLPWCVLAACLAWPAGAAEETRPLPPFGESVKIVLEASVGKGKVFLFGPEVTFRGQPHGTFKFVFNGIYLGTATAVTLK